MPSRIPHRNQSPYGWWVTTYVRRACWDGDCNLDELEQNLVWKNTIILQAPDREAAYTKAVELGSADCGEFWDEAEPSRTGRWVFEGLTMLLPIYEDLCDGAEILWEEHHDVPISTIRSWVKSRSELEVFNGVPSSGDRT